MRAMNKFLSMLSLGIRYTKLVFVYTHTSAVAAAEFSRLAGFYGCHDAFLGREFSAEIVITLGDAGDPVPQTSVDNAFVLY